MSDPRSNGRSKGLLSRLVVLSVPLLLIAVACSNDDGAAATATAAATEAPATEAPMTEAPATEAPMTDAPMTEAPADGTDAAGGVPALDFGSGTGSITLFDETFDFDIGPGAGLCRDVFGIIQAGGKTTDADGIEITSDFYIPPLDWASFEDGRYDPPSVYLEFDTGDHIGRWTADAGDEMADEGTSQIDDYQKEGLTASGTGTFRNAWDSEAESVQGSFEISCDEE